MIKLNCQSANSKKYSDPSLLFDVDHFIQNKIPSSDSFDIIIEMVSYSAPNKFESILATYCNISDESVNTDINRRNNYKIKHIKQEIFILEVNG